MKHRKVAARTSIALKHAPISVADDRNPRYLRNSTEWPRRMYAIAFDLDTERLKELYHNASWQNAYEDIRRVLETHGFERQQGSVYFGDANKVDAVRCVIAVQELTRSLAWFASSISDIRMLRIEENNDLMPAVEEVVPRASTPAP